MLSWRNSANELKLKEAIEKAIKCFKANNLKQVLKDYGINGGFHLQFFGTLF